MEVTKLRKNTFRHIETELYCYHETLKYIEQRRMELTSDYVEQHDVPINSEPTQYNSQTERYASRLLMDKRLQETQRIVQAIERVYTLCDDNKQKLIRLKYWTKPQLKTWEGISQELCVGRMTAFRWRDEIVQAIAENLGWY